MLRYVPVACELLGHRGPAKALLEASEAFGRDAEACRRAASRCVAEAWQLLLLRPSEALLHCHALGHGMLARLAEGEEAMSHADAALALCPDLAIPALHSVMRACDLSCRHEIRLEGAWEICSELPASPKTPLITRPMRRMPCVDLSLMAFRELLQAPEPLVVSGHLSCAQWRTAQWQDLRFWARHGHRRVPVEFGQQEEAAKEQGTSLEAFLCHFLLPSNEVFVTQRSWPTEPIDEWSVSKVAYMAQHQLFLQIPELIEDIKVPHYCSLGELQTVNLWMGTAGTVTALHYDLNDNFLVQVAGFKPGAKPF